MSRRTLATLLSTPRWGPPKQLLYSTICRRGRPKIGRITAHLSNQIGFRRVFSTPECSPELRQFPTALSFCYVPRSFTPTRAGSLNSPPRFVQPLSVRLMAKCWRSMCPQARSQLRFLPLGTFRILVTNRKATLPSFAVAKQPRPRGWPTWRSLTVRGRLWVECQASYGGARSKQRVGRDIPRFDNGKAKRKSNTYIHVAVEVKRQALE